MKELNAIEKLEAVESIMKNLGYDFSNMTIEEGFSLFRILRDEIDMFMKDKQSIKPNIIDPGFIEIQILYLILGMVYSIYMV